MSTLRSRLPRWLAAVCLVAATASAGGGERAVRSRFLGPAYPLEADAPLPAALLHWLDSLADLHGPGFTAGKTTPTHRTEYEATFGRPTTEDLTALRDFARVRRQFASGAERPSCALTVAFFESETLDDALRRSRELLDDESYRRFRSALHYFAPRYARVWDDGRVTRRFVDRVHRDPDRRRLGRFLRDLAVFFGVSLEDAPAARLILAPVRDGHGTHAQAIGRYLLVEIRERETLADEVEPIVHENAHFLFERIPAKRQAALQATAEATGAGGLAAWGRLREALPTAIGQGVAGQRFRGDAWSVDRHWYHRRDVDRYAKAIFPLVRETLSGDGTFDEALVRRLIALAPADD